MQCDNCGFDNGVGELLKPELRSANRTKALDFSRLFPGVLSFTTLIATGETPAQLITNTNLMPLHIGQTAGQPIAAYLCIRDCFITLDAVGAAISAEGVVIYRDLQGYDHIIGAFGVAGLVASGSAVFSHVRLRLISETPIGERVLTNLGSIRVNLVTLNAGIGSLDIRVYTNMAVHYGL